MTVHDPEWVTEAEERELRRSLFGDDYDDEERDGDPGDPA
jgi:hypothetical protein